MAPTPQQNASKRLPFATQTYHLDSVPASAQRILNLYPEQQPPEALTGVTLRSVGGLTTIYVLNNDKGPVRAMNAKRPGFVYVVCGDQFYRVNNTTPITIDSLGTIPPSTLVQNYPTTIDVGPTAAVVCSPPNAFVVGHQETQMHQISPGTFPGASSVAYIDGYFVFTQVDTAAQFFFSGLLAFDNYDALDFANVDTRPNVIKRVILHRGELWFLGEGGNEVWYDVGNQGLSLFPFARRLGADSPLGCISPASVVEVIDSLIYLGSDNVVYQTQGYTPLRISTHAIEQMIEGRQVKAQATGMTYTYDGHHFYVLTLPASVVDQSQPALTLVYDVTTQRWHERQSGNSDGPWRPACAVMTSTQAQFGDSLTGRVYVLSETNELDDDLPKPWVATLPPIWGDTERDVMNRLELEMQTGRVTTTPGIGLEISDDGGWTFKPIVYRNSGPAGALRERVFWTRRGSFRNRVLRFSGLGPVTLYGADADITQGVA